jgi:hypothetical protein
MACRPASLSAVLPLLLVLPFACHALPAWGQAPAAARPAGDPVATDPAGRLTPADRGKEGTGLRIGRPEARRVLPGSVLSIIKERNGQKTLIVDYRWQVHSQASIEIRLVPEGAAPVDYEPLRFLTEYFKDDFRNKIHRSLDHAGEHPKPELLTKADSNDPQTKLDFTIVGKPNSRGRPSVMVLGTRRVAKPDPHENSLAIFPILEPWSIDDRMLALELPREEFSKQGRLWVWFLRGDKAIWLEKIEWPGY